MIVNQIQPPPSQSGMSNGPCQPPRKRLVATAEMVTMLMYSAMKNMANRIELYSV